MIARQKRFPNTLPLSDSENERVSELIAKWAGRERQFIRHVCAAYAADKRLEKSGDYRDSETALRNLSPLGTGDYRILFAAKRAMEAKSETSI